MSDQNFDLPTIVQWAQSHVRAMREAHVADWHCLRAEMILDALQWLRDQPAAAPLPASAALQAQAREQVVAEVRAILQRDLSDPDCVTALEDWCDGELDAALVSRAPQQEQD